MLSQTLGTVKPSSFEANLTVSWLSTNLSRVSIGPSLLSHIATHFLKGHRAKGVLDICAEGRADNTRLGWQYERYHDLR